MWSVICQYKGMSYHSAWYSVLTVPAAFQLPSTGQPWKTVQSVAFLSLLPSRSEKSLNHCDYFKLLFLHKQWEMAEEATLLEQSCITYTLCNLLPLHPLMQLTLNSAQIHPAQLAADHSPSETFCPRQKHGLACNWSPVTHPAQQLCSTASWRCPLSTWIRVACTALTVTPLLFMFCFLTGKVLAGQLQTYKIHVLNFHVCNSLEATLPLASQGQNTHTGKR